jgi:hypothetical protein
VRRPEHADLLPHVQEMKRLKRLGRRKKEEPPPPAAAPDHSPEQP